MVWEEKEERGHPREDRLKRLSLSPVLHTSRLHFRPLGKSGHQGKRRARPTRERGGLGGRGEVGLGVACTNWGHRSKKVHVQEGEMASSKMEQNESITGDGRFRVYEGKVSSAWGAMGKLASSKKTCWPLRRDMVRPIAILAASIPSSRVVGVTEKRTRATATESQRWAGGLSRGIKRRTHPCRLGCTR